MLLEKILQKRLVFVSGKGGVGKTSVSTLIALMAAKQKKKVLIVEMNATGRVSPLFGCEEVSDEVIPLAPYISTINLKPSKCFEEYVLKHVRFKKIYDVFFNNQYVGNFIKSVPGLNEVLMLGKIYDLEKMFRNKALKKKEYDLIVVDAPATGHGLSAFEVPKVILSAVKIGPMHNHAQSIINLLSNKDKTMFCLVTLAEEMPVAESKDYIKALKERTQLSFGPLFINAVMDMPDKIEGSHKLKDEHGVFKQYYQLAHDRALLNKEYVSLIKREFKEFEQVVLPYQFTGLCKTGDFNSLINLLSKSD